MKILTFLLLSIWVGNMYAQDIILMRHGEYMGEDLTGVGISQVVKAAERLKREYAEVDKIYYSGKTRTLQNAKLLSDVYGKDRLKELSWLNDDNPMPIELSNDIQGGVVIIVSHSPVLRKLSEHYGINIEAWKYAEFVIIKR